MWVMVTEAKTLGGGGVQAAAGPVVDEGGGHEGGTRRVSRETAQDKAALRAKAARCPET